MSTITQRAGSEPILDLACGNGRNGIYLVNKGHSVVFADRREDKLGEIKDALAGNQHASFWNIDFEQPGHDPLAGHCFSAILVFRYLHRPLMRAIKGAVIPGGFIVYETFTAEQPRFGRPRNPDFLLDSGELEEVFHDWEILHSFEGVTVSETSDKQQAIAQVVARKPLS